MPPSRPVVLITGSVGEVGEAVIAALQDAYEVAGLDKHADGGGPVPVVGCDLTDDASTASALDEVRERFGDRLASVIHLAGYYDFTGEDDPLYRTLNVDGTRRLLDGLQRFRVEQFVYAGTMLVHEAVRPGERLDETRRLHPTWAYPRSKAAAEAVIRERHGAIPCVLLHLAGLYGDRTLVPTLAHQVARIREKDLESHVYPGDLRAGQSMIHHADMADAFRRAVDRRGALPAACTVLVGEPDPPGYGELQDLIGRELHGEAWTTLRVPALAAAAGAWVQDRVAPHLPRALGGDPQPFVRPFMALEASDHYALDVTRARELLGWTPKHRLADALPSILAELRRDPRGWYQANGLELPPELQDRP